MRAASGHEELLIGWLQRLVALLLAAGGAVARQLERNVLDKPAGLQLDGACLVLLAARDSAGEVGVAIWPAEPGAAPARQLATSGQALRDVIEGRTLLDSAVAQGLVDLKAPLAELLSFHELVMLALAMAPRSPALRALWQEFDATWPREAACCAPLEAQVPRYGGLAMAVPPEVRLARSPAASSAGSE